MYHINGERPDNCSAITRDPLTNKTICDVIFNRDRVQPNSPIVRLEVPALGGEIFRVASTTDGGQVRYLYYDANGKLVNYKY